MKKKTRTISSLFRLSTITSLAMLFMSSVGFAEESVNDEADSVVTIYNETFSGNTYFGNGGAIANSGTITIIEDSIFTNNYAYIGSGGAIHNSSTITTITGTTFSGNKATMYGGAIANYGTIGEIIGSYDPSSTSELTNSEADFYNNTASSNGGAIYIDTGDKIGSISNVSFADNKVTGTASGGAIYALGTITTISDSIFTGNEAYWAGAIYTKSKIDTISNVIFSDNKATGYYGGAIAICLSTASIDLITGSTFNGNEANTTGGAIHSIGTITTISDSIFTGNEAGTLGGAIYSTKSIGTITGTTFSNNKANTSGGAIYNVGTIDEIIGSYVVGAELTNTDADFYNNTAGTSGGAIYNTNGGSITTISNVSFANNTTTTDSGGAIYNLGTITTIENSIFDGNTATSKYGGAIYTTGSIGTISGTTFSDNEATFGGAIILNSTSASIDLITDSTFTGNEATTNSGGAIYSIGSIGTISGTTFSDNEADFGGAIILNSTSASIDLITDSTFTGNEADTSGGAIYNAGTIGTISDTEFSYNKASFGGAIYNAGTLMLSASTFTGNEAVDEGGAIYNIGILTISDNVVFESNKQTGSGSNGGGAVYNEGGSVTISDNVSFVSNTSIKNGAAIYNVYGTVTIGSSSYSGDAYEVYFTSNNATSWGGAIYNTSDYYGDAGTLTIYNASFTNNTATTGGAIVNNGNPNGEDNATLTISNSIFDNNKATASGGGAIYNAYGTSSITDTIFTNNKATSSGGAIYNASSGTIESITDTTFTGNSAGTQGGAIYNYGGSITIASTSGSDIVNSGNYAGSNYSEASSTDDANGGFLYQNSGSTTFNTVANSSITIGTAGIGGEGYDSIAGTGTITKTGEGTLTVNSSMASFTGTLNVEEGTMEYSNKAELGASVVNVSGVLSGDITFTSGADLNVYITANNASETVLDGTISGITSIDVYINDIASILGTSTTVLGNEYSDSIKLNTSNIDIDSSYYEVETGTYTITIANSVTITQDDASATYSSDTESTDVNIEITGAYELTDTSSSSTLNITSAAGTDDASVDIGTLSVSSDVETAATLTNVDLVGGNITMSGTGDITAVKIDKNSNVTGDMSLSADNANSATLLEATDGIIYLGKSGETITLSATAGDDYATALTNKAGTAGLTVALTGNVIVEGNIVANSPFILDGDNDTLVGSDLITSGTYDFSSDDILTVTGSITTGDGDVAGDSATITDATLVLDGDSASLNTYYAAGNTYGDLTISGYGALVAQDEASVVVGNISVDVDSELSVLSGSTVTSSGYLDIEGTLTVEAGTDSSIATDSLSYDGTTLTLTDNAGLLVGETWTTGIFTADTDYNSDNFDYDSTSGVVKVVSSSYFAGIAENENESDLGDALDAMTGDTGDTDYQAKIDFKEGIDAAGLSSYVIGSNSYIAEVNNMLLSNQNFANVNRARRILENSAGVQIPDEDGSISIENEDGTISVVDASEVSLIKYSNVAQLQVISLMGNKNSSNGVAGYEYYSVGSTANFDEILSENALVGVSIGGTYNKVSGDAGDNANSTTFLLNAYAVYAYEGLEVFGNVGYAHFWNEGSKGSARADWDSDAFNALIGVSYTLETVVEGLSVIPVAMLNFVCQDADSATYSNGVTVDDQSYFSAKLMLGFEVEYAINAQFKALARAMYSHECGDTSYDNTYSLGFLNGVNYIGSEAGADSALMGLGLSYDFSETCTAYFDYNAYAYSNLITHSLNLSVALKF